MGASIDGSVGGGPPRATVFARLGAGGLVVVMSIGGVAMWIGAPAAWLWVGSQLTESQRPLGSVYMIVGTGILVTMTLLGLALGRLNRIHGEMTGRLQRGRTVRNAWSRPQSHAAEGRPPVNALEAIMVGCVVLVGILFFVWFFFFAESSINYWN
ncbi:MAG TPA: hypothetical protein VF520_03190 [Thermoleophilaceae bacterium]|jgi:hypothetical protein